MLRVFITDLAAYNNGYLVGEWVNLPMEKEELELSIKDILSQGEKVCKYGSHEEYFITDYEWEDVTVFSIQEYDNPYLLNEKLTLLTEKVDSVQYKNVKTLLENELVENFEDAIANVDKLIVYENSTMKDVAMQYIEEFVDLNGYHSLIVNHIDYEGIGRDLEIQGSYFKDSSDIFQYIG
ncbi:MAG: Unknown protein [uncultured Sulfurovum sp.]|uniref:Antirestriction protein ArdA n=1 Tax=uncultured Sulfurovum sp. TaxID=269237 RepID=A0A6S6SFU8_9BACT|nr:MAG: Unknown protein [uncultured Sulfurovum sp.]